MDPREQTTSAPYPGGENRAAGSADGLAKAAAPRESELVRAHAANDMEREILAKVVHVLADRLQPVIRPEIKPERDDDDRDSEYTTPRARQVETSTQHIKSMRLILEGVLNNLEV